MNTDRRAHAVAIVSSDPLLAALVGAAVELIGYRAAFPRANESGAEALTRMRPAFVLIECDDAWLDDEPLLGRALMTGARLFLFGRERDVERHSAMMARYGMASIELPNDFHSLQDILSRRVSPRDLTVKR